MVMFEITKKLKQILPWCLVVVVSSVYMWHFNNLNNDFQVFYKAGLDFRNGVNPWGSRLDPNAMYLNGSSTLILFSILSFFPLEGAIFFVRVLSLVMVAFSIFKVRNLLHRIPQPQLIIFLFLAFPVRSALEYGQLTIIFSAIAFYILMRINNRSADTILVILGVTLILDFKPHIFIGVVTYLTLMRRVTLLIKAFFVWLVFQFIVGLYHQIIPFIEMLKAIAFRSETVTKGEDSFSIVSIFDFDSRWSTMISLSSVLIFVIYSYTNNREPASKLLSITAFSLLITPLLHPTDLMLLLLVFVVKTELAHFSSLVMGMFFVWSPQFSGAGFTFIVILTSVCVSLFCGYRFSIKEIALLLLPNIVFFLLIRSGLDEVVVRHSIHLMIPILIGVYYSFGSSKMDSAVAKSG
jgi:hypothetical protein